MDELKRLIDRWKRTWLEKYFLGDDYGGEKRPNKHLHKDIISSYFLGILVKGYLS